MERIRKADAEKERHRDPIPFVNCRPLSIFYTHTLRALNRVYHTLLGVAHRYILYSYWVNMCRTNSLIVHPETYRMDLSLLLRLIKNSTITNYISLFQLYFVVKNYA